jgi:hypothetical protein
VRALTPHLQGQQDTHTFTRLHNFQDITTHLSNGDCVYAWVCYMVFRHLQPRRVSLLLSTPQVVKPML